MPARVIPLTPSVEFDAALVRKLNQMGPRYTSYPTADRFNDAFGAEQYRTALTQLDAAAGGTDGRPWSLYVHIPFCESLCYYCGCNKIITQDHSKAAEYLVYLEREIVFQAATLGPRRAVAQLHFGGGTPTYLSDAQMSGLLDTLRRHFDFVPQEEGEFSIEVDPRTVTPERIATLRAQGFNRISLGIQDFDPAVQQAVNRIQSYEQTMDVLQAARTSGFRSISVDLIYGLPLQSVASFGPTLDKVIAARPDRIAIYNYAHMPQMFKSQRLIRAEDLPDAEEKLAMLGLCIERLTAAGYVYIGMDHFALPEDDLAVSQCAGKLQRNFQGYSTHAEAPMLALGVSGISAVGASYSQNEKVLSEYYARLDRNELPIKRGIALNEDDLLRRSVISRLMCDFELHYADLAIPDGFTAAEYFVDELERLPALAADGLLKISDKGLKVTMRGRLLIRNICMVFDRYLQAPRAEGPHLPRYSRTI